LNIQRNKVPLSLELLQVLGIPSRPYIFRDLNIQRNKVPLSLELLQVLGIPSRPYIFGDC